jgi:hypothetical protein
VSTKRLYGFSTTDRPREPTIFGSTVAAIPQRPEPPPQPAQEEPRQNYWLEALAKAKRERETQVRPGPSATPIAELPPDEVAAMRRPARPPTQGRDYNPYD